MRIVGVDVPQAVIDAQKRGELVVFAGAGVSIDAPSNYPNFETLAKQIGQAAFHPKNEEPIDRYLGRLKEAGVDVHERVKRILSNPDSRPNALHENIIRLFASSDTVRIVTTNFDDHFRGAAISEFGSVPRLYQAPALPLGDDFLGIVHLHGSVRDDAKSLVLTDADFGRAYLTQGWARRFVQALYTKYTVLFIGYSHQDLPLLYLARGLSAAISGPGRYALDSPGKNTDWFSLGITPIHYPLQLTPMPRHGALSDCVAEWAKIASLGSIGTEARIQQIVTAEGPVTLDEFDFLKQALVDTSTLRYFTRYARNVRWLHWIAETLDFRAIFIVGDHTNTNSCELAFWFADHFAIDHYLVAIDLVRDRGQTLSNNLWYHIATKLFRDKTQGAPLRLWVSLLLENMPANATSDLLAYIIGNCTLPQDQHVVLQLFRKLTSPRVKLRRAFRHAHTQEAQAPDAEIVPVGSEYWINHIYVSQLRPHLTALGAGLISIVTASLEQARVLFQMYAKDGAMWDPISFGRGSTTSRTQDHLHNGFSALIDAGNDALQSANKSDPELASVQIAQWIRSEAPILRRLAITGMTNSPLHDPSEKTRWAITNELIKDFHHKHETLILLKESYARSTRELRAELVSQVETKYRPDGPDYERYELFSVLSWLNSNAPECDAAAEKLRAIQLSNPEWRMREHPEFSSWSSGGIRQLIADSPVTVERIEGMNLDEVILECSRLESVVDPFGDPFSASFLQDVSRAAAANLEWSKGITSQAMAKSQLPTQIIAALVRGWATAHTPDEWTILMDLLMLLEPVYGSITHELASLFRAATEDKTGNLPRALFESALSRANTLWLVCSQIEGSLPDTSNDWLVVALNRVSGVLAQFYLNALRFLNEKPDEDRSVVPSILAALGDMINGDRPSCEITRILVAAHARVLAEVAPEWYETNVLSLLSSTQSLRSAQQTWDGYLIWGGWSPEMVRGLLPHYLNHLLAITHDSDDRSRMYCGHLAHISLFGSVDPIDEGWLDTFLVQSKARERLTWIAEVTQYLRQVNQKAKDSVWDRWLHRYLQRRSQSNPIPLDSRECGAMCVWALVLDTHYSQLVELLLIGPPPDAQGDMFYYQLWKDHSPLLDQAPVLTARLLTALRSQDDASKILYWEPLHDMAAKLINRDPAEPALRALCEQLGRLHSPRAQEFASWLHNQRDNRT